MNEFILVEFLVKSEDKPILLKKLNTLSYGFTQLTDEYEWEHDDDDFIVEQWYRIWGRINSVDATMIKLQDPFLSEHMRVSYIPDDLKNKYRK